ncbi:MAG: hypothetical protein HY270_03605 [Deltaproteobacteria bacterium]|nr:hypothetical protein [Deltaproteobacteria bacterium]
MDMLVEAMALLVCPTAAGILFGAVLQLILNHRLRGFGGAAICLALPVLVAALLTVGFPIIGLWDGVAEGFLCGAGLLFSAHQMYADWRNVPLTLAGIVVSLAILEVAVRLSLGPPPAYSPGDGPHLLLATFVRSTGPDSPLFQTGAMPELVAKQAMQGDLNGRTMTDRPPGAMVTKEIVCSIVYGSAYSGVLDVSQQRSDVFPEHVDVRPQHTRRVLHVGDSMVYGANVVRDQTFVARLGEIEPNVRHVNGGISGTAPDDYLAVIRSWLARQPFDLVVMYLFEGNDISGLDAPHPCSNWQSLLSYDSGRALLRFPDAPNNESRIGLQWLLANSPLPYLGRVMIVAHSSLAAYLGGLLDAWSSRSASANGHLLWPHLEVILQTARDELREKHVELTVVVLPSAAGIENPDDPIGFATHVRSISRRLGLHELDATQTIRDALARGEHPIQGDRTHFNEAGHQRMAQWLHQQLEGPTPVALRPTSWDGFR